MWRVFGLFLFGICSLLASPLSAQTVTGISLSVNGTQTQVTIERKDASASSSLPVPKIFVIDGTSPRIVADFKKTKADLQKLDIKGRQNQIKGGGHIKKIRYAVRGTSDLRIVFDLEPKARLVRPSIARMKTGFIVEGENLTPKFAESRSKQARLSKPCYNPPCPRLAPHVLKAVSHKLSPQVDITKPVKAVRSKAALKPRYFEKNVPYPQLKPGHIVQIAKVKRRPVIVIDPGHGGRDPGAIGTRKTREKDITYKASLKLRAELLKSGRYEVILTRTKDRYIEHSERLRIARAGGADLFISVHADSTSSKTARGASVYTLADRAKKRSKNIVSTQNWIMDVDLQKQSNSVGDILVDLAQRKTATQSDRFADILLRELKGTTRLIGNSHRKAGYFVLLAPDVPAVLLELGFLSNPQDEKLLNSEAHRAKIVKSVRKAIDTYFNEEKR